MSSNASNGQIELVHPLYLDVPMMTSFLAAIDDGIAYGSNVKLKQGSQRTSGTSGEAEAGIPKLGILSSVLSLSLRGKIENKSTLDDGEEVELVRKHTEASLFMQLRSILHEEAQIIIVESEDDLARVAHRSLVEVTGQILRSPADAALDNFFKMMTMMGLDMSDDSGSQSQKSSGKGGGQNQPRRDPFQQLQQAFESRSTEVALRIMHRLRDDFKKSKVIDVVMELPSAQEYISIVISLSSEFLPDGALENLLSGQFTVLGKVTRVLKGEDTINLYQRSTLGSMLSANEQLQAGIAGLQQHFASGQAAGTELIRAPGLQLIPLAVFV